MAKESRQHTLSMRRLLWWSAGLAMAICTVRTQAETLIAGTTEYPPYEFVRDGRVVGADTELVEAVIRRMGYEPRFRLMPWQRVELEADSGQLDLIFSLVHSEERAQRFLYSEPISDTREVFFKRRSDDIRFSRLTELSNLRIGTVFGYVYATEFSELVAQGILKIEPITGDQVDLRSLAKLSMGRIDLYLCDQRIGMWYLQSSPMLSEIDFIDRQVGRTMFFHAAFPRGTDDPARAARSVMLRDRFNEALRSMPASQLQEIRERYYSGPLDPPGPADAPPPPASAAIPPD